MAFPQDRLIILLSSVIAREHPAPSIVSLEENIRRYRPRSAASTQSIFLDCHHHRKPADCADNLPRTLRRQFRIGVLSHVVSIKFVRASYQAILTTAMLSSNDQPQRLTADAVSSLVDMPKTQLQDWLEKLHTHERLGAQGNSAQRAAEIEAFLHDFDEKMASNATGSSKP